MIEGIFTKSFKKEKKREKKTKAFSLFFSTWNSMIKLQLTCCFKNLNKS